MRVARTLQSGQGQAPLFLYGPNNIFTRKLASNAPLNGDQSPALKMANQLSYGNTNYSYNGSPAPSFYGYSGTGYGGAPFINYWQYTIPVYIVSSTVPTQTVIYVEGDGVTPQPPGTAANLQNFFNAVPVPDVTKIPQGQIQATGTDGHACFWRPSTNELWEMWRFNGSPGNYVFQYAGYTASANTFNGIFPHDWGARATSLAAGGGLIMIQDIVDVLNGLPIRHAIGVELGVTANATIAPATRNDTTSTTPQFAPDGTTPNPAYGFVDGVAESTWCRFPASFNPASAMPGAGPIQLAMATAIRDYGMFVMDGGNGSRFNVEDTRVLGTPYSYAKVNPFAGSTGAAAGHYDTRTNQYVPSTWTDAALPKITELLDSTSIVSEIPWQNLQMLQPFSS
jgi:hypothetical protein